ncbi:MAG: 16S rRNA (uracil(1498)-N(3))-methyltransferase [Clostridiaceae bacterium]|nr:16S rRNA (uracil(1498)-N(3))-methyltransferase [Clostridiaceae bacterium]
MTRLFVDKRIEHGATTHILDDSDSRYIRDVLRMRSGERLILCDPDSTEYEAIVTSPGSKHIELTLSPGRANQTEPLYRAVLYQGLPKGDKMSGIIQKSVELGVSGIVPVSCARSIVKIDPGDLREKTTRWQKISHEAARQSERGRVPWVSETMSFREAIETATKQSDLTLIPWEEESGKSLAEALEPLDNKRRCQNPNPDDDIGPDLSDPERSLPNISRREGPLVSIFIGPEGGFEKKEVAFAKECGAVSVSLGKRILRTETAGIAVLSMLLYRLELL